MLEELRLAGLGVIDEAVLSLSAGLTVLTGETGAGKTMVLSGLTLLFGGRADTALVWSGASAALVEGRLRLDPDHPVCRQAGELGADLDADGTLLITRVVSAQGRSRCQVGGRAVPVGTLAELGAGLLAVHGQADQFRLRRPAEQRAALDRFAGAGVATAAADYRDVFARLRGAAGELAELTERAREREREAEELRAGLARIAAVAPGLGEEDELAALDVRLSHADLLTRAALAAHELISAAPESESADAAGLVARAVRELEAAVATDPGLAELAARVGEVGALLTDVGADLAVYAQAIEAEPARLAAVQQRRADLAGLLRRYGPDTAAALAWAEQARARLAELESDTGRRAALAAEVEALTGAAAGHARRLSDARREAGQRFAAAVRTELAALAMPRASVQVRVEQTADPRGLPWEAGRVAFGAHGVDEVTLLLAAHPDAPPRPLGQGASGGELSRVMLAVEVVLAAGASATTMVFDEVDAGVGGAAAVEVGRRLQLLARTHQVLCVTHLAQVAAFADTHLVVDRAADGQLGRSGVREVRDGERRRELARMLGGLAESRSGHQHAAELLALARPGSADWQDG